VGVIFPAASDDVIVTIPTGSHTGAILVNKANVTYRGGGRDLTTIRSDLTYNYTILPAAGIGGTITLEDFTIDAGDLNLSIVVSVSTAHFVMRRCRITNYSSGTIAIFNQSSIDMDDVEIIGNGPAYKIHSDVSSGNITSRLNVLGGTGGIIVTDGGLLGVVPVGPISGCDIDLAYYANPLGERNITPTSVGKYSVGVTTNVIADRSLYDVVVFRQAIGSFNTSFTVGQPIPLASDVRRWDRLEASDGRWARVIEDADGQLVVDRWRSPRQWHVTSSFTGEATLYRPHLMRLYSWTETELSMLVGNTPYTRWHYADGEAAQIPTLTSGSLVDILRHGLNGGPRDVDVGGIHIPYSGRDSVISDTRVRSTFSDSITVRGRNIVSQRCSTSGGQDMGWTVDGLHYRQTLEDCEALSTGYNGFTIIHGPSTLINCTGSLNGVHCTADNTLQSAYGYSFDDDSIAGSRVQGMSGNGNFGGLGSHASASYSSPRVSIQGGAGSIGTTASTIARVILPGGRRR
jgi:hypothetical protein